MIGAFTYLSVINLVTNVSIGQSVFSKKFSPYMGSCMRISKYSGDNSNIWEKISKKGEKCEVDVILEWLPWGNEALPFYGPVNWQVGGHRSELKVVQAWMVMRRAWGQLTLFNIIED